MTETTAASHGIPHFPWRYSHARHARPGFTHIYLYNFSSFYIFPVEITGRLRSDGHDRNAPVPLRRPGG
jgi:hypothetical protein